MDDPVYILTAITVILYIVFIIWAFRKFTKWVSRVVDKQQEISMLKARAMMLAAENGQKFNNF